MADGDPLLEAAMAIADGTPVDWPSVSTPEGRPHLLDELRFLEALVRAHSAALADDGLREHESLLHPVDRSDDHEPVSTSWGPLTVQEKVGRGAFGDVYRAWDPRLERTVALKLLRHREVETGDDRAVVEEARLLARVRHPHILTVYGADRSGGRTGFWTEFVEGTSLADEIARSGPLAPRDVAAIGCDVAEALDAVHAAGLLHRDVKAQNVLREVSGRVVLGDFGAGTTAAALAAGNSPGAGTPLYLAPSILAGAPASPSTDFYSLGVLLYFLATGAFPVSGRTLAEIRTAHETRARIAVRTRAPGLPPELGDTIEMLLDGRLTKGAAVVARLESLVEARVTTTRTQHVSRTVPIAAGIVLTTLLVGMMAVLWRAPRTDQAPPAGTVVRLLAKDPECLGPLAPNARSIACVQRATGNLALVDTASQTLRELTSGGSPRAGVRAHAPVFSPDARTLAYTWVMGSSAPAEVRVTTVDGGRTRTVVSGAPDTSLTVLGWRPDGRSLLVERRTGPRRAIEWTDVASGLVLATRDTDVPPGGFVRFFGWTGGRAVIGLQDASMRVVIRAETPEDVHQIGVIPFAPSYTTLSPDGRWLAYDSIQHADGPEHDIFAMDLTSGTIQTVVAHPAFDVGPIWTQDGTHLLFSSDRSGPMGLWAVAMDGITPAGEPELIRELGRRHAAPLGLSRTGALIYQLATGAFDVYEAGIGADGLASAPKRTSARIVDTNLSPAWSPDGGRLAFVTSKGPFNGEPGTTRITVQDRAAGRATDLLLTTRLPSARIDWSPDGRQFVLRGFLGTRWGLHLLDAETAGVVDTFTVSTTQRFVEDAIGDVGWSEGGRAILFVHDFGISRLNLARRTVSTLVAPGTDRVMSLAVAADGRAAYSVVRPDGSWVVRRVELATAAPQDVWHLPQGEAAMVSDWAPGSDDIVLSRFKLNVPWKDRREELWRISADGARQTFAGLAIAGLREARMAPDGRTVVFTAGFSGRELWQMEGFTRELPRAVRR